MKMRYRKRSLRLYFSKLRIIFSLKIIFVFTCAAFAALPVFAQEIETIEYWEKVVADNPDNAQAWFNIGVLYELGRGGVELDLDKAETYHRKSAALNYAPASFNIGAIYARRKDYSNAIKWWEKASEESVPEAQYNLAWLYEKGVGVEQNQQKAVEYYANSAQTAMNKYFRLFQESKTGDATTMQEFQARSGWGWVTRQPQKHYTIQLTASNKESDTYKFIQRYALESKVIVIPAISKGKVYYKVLLGSFNAWSDAVDKLENLPQDMRNKKPWIRSFSSLYVEMPESIRSQLKEQALLKIPPEQYAYVESTDNIKVRSSVNTKALPAKVKQQARQKLVIKPVFGPLVAEPIVEDAKLEVIKQLRPTGTEKSNKPTVERIDKNTSYINNPYVQQESVSKASNDEPGADAIKPASSSAALAQLVNEPGWDWVLKQPQKYYTIQLFASERKDKTLKFIQQHALKSQVIVIPAIVNGSNYYKVVLGSFKVWNDAAVEIGGLDSDLRQQKPWVRSFSALKSEMPDRLRLQLEEQTIVSEQSVELSAVVEDTDVSIQSLADSSKAQQSQSQAVQTNEINAAEPIAETEVASVNKSLEGTKKKKNLTPSTVVDENNNIYNPYTLRQLASKGIDEKARADLRSALSAMELKNYTLAFGLFDGLAKKGMPEAQYRQAWLFSGGFGVKQNKYKAFNLARSAAEQGHPYSQKLLAGFYLNGSGVEKNTALAEYWRQTAEDNINNLYR